MATSAVTPIYNAHITAGSLLVRESRAIAALLLQEPTPEQWRQAIVVDNILQKSAPSSSMRMATLLRQRLKSMPPEFLEPVVNSSRDVTLQLLLASAIKQSRILADFMLRVAQARHREFARQLQRRDWDHFLEECRQLDPTIALWSASTQNKMREVVFRILAEAGYLENSRSCVLQPVSILPEVRTFLEQHHEFHLLNCLDISHE